MASSSAAAVYQKRVKGFPRAPILLSAASAAGLYWLGGVGGWGALLFGVVQFSVLGGTKFCKLFFKTVPRDLRCVVPTY